MGEFSRPMGLRFQVMGSSSSGNCALIETESTRVLLDAGFSGRKLCQMLEAMGRSIESIDAVFLTHEHGDHAQGMRGLSRFRHLQFFANYPTAEVVQASLSRKVNWNLFETGQRFQFRDLTIETLLLPHDAMEPVAYHFRTGDGSLFQPYRSLAWVTDLGHIPRGLPAFVREAHLLVLETNHDADLLQADEKRPFSVKARIAGRHGHLSNAAARDFLASVERPLWRKILCGHLSKDCNRTDAVLQALGNGQCPWPVECIDPEAGPGQLLEV
jgi:phosphoribosyl 1,2-cyclic phosphodiesterase